LGSEPGLTTIWYELVFDDDCTMYVRMTHDFESPNKSDRITRLESENFKNHKIEGVPLVEIIKKKLLEILPPSN